MPCGDAESERKTCREAGGDDMELHEAADIFRHFAVDADVCGCDAFGNGNSIRPIGCGAPTEKAIRSSGSTPSCFPIPMR